jgi:hypothetical protein
MEIRNSPKRSPMRRNKTSLIAKTTIWLVISLLLSVGLLAQDSSNCAAGYTLSVMLVKCPCSTASIYVGSCQRLGGGSGCAPGGSTVTCAAGNCSSTILSASGCIASGPKMPLLSSSLRHQLETLFTEAPKIATLTCNNDTRAFERWLMETSSPRRIQSLKIGD